MIKAMIAALALAGCASVPGTPAHSGQRDQDRQEDRVRGLQDEFNAQFPNG